MGGCRCSFRDCPNTTKTENIHFFHYPVKHKERCRVWIDNALKPQFCDLEEEQLRNKVICDQHFEEKWFPNPQRKRLLQGAIPTLLGNNVTEASNGTITKEKEPPLFPQHHQDIQVLPANDDGTVFVLDTDTMFTKSSKIESYVYENGSLLPSSVLAPLSAPFHRSTWQNLKRSVVGESFNHQLIESNVVEKVEPPDVTVKTEIPDYIERTSDSQVNSTEQSDANYEPLPKRSATDEKVVHYPVKQFRNAPDRDQPVLGKTYMRKIKQHSRDIASIKKLLKEKTIVESKPSITSVLEVLREELPPSLYTVVTLSLNQECQLTEDDVDFFTIIHRLSPTVYELLTEKFKWNLPSVDIVDSVE